MQIYLKLLRKIELQELIISDDVVITDTGFDIANIDEIIIGGYGEQKVKSTKFSKNGSLYYLFIDWRGLKKNP